MSVEDIIVFGTGGTARDLMETLEAINEDARRWNILGWVDDNPALTGTTILDYPVLGSREVLGLPKYRNCRIVLGVGSHRNRFIRRTIREALCDLYGIGAGRYPVIVHPAATVSRRVQFGEGAMIFSGAFCSNNCRIGNHAMVLQGTVVGHDTSIGDYATLAANIAMGGSVSIGDGAYLGLGAVVYPKVRIGTGSIVGLGSVVILNVSDGQTVSGNPARLLGAPDRSMATMQIGATGTPA